MLLLCSFVQLTVHQAATLKNNPRCVRGFAFQSFFVVIKDPFDHCVIFCYLFHWKGNVDLSSCSVPLKGVSNIEVRHLTLTELNCKMASPKSFPQPDLSIQAVPPELDELLRVVTRELDAAELEAAVKSIKVTRKGKGKAQQEQDVYSHLLEFANQGRLTVEDLSLLERFVGPTALKKEGIKERIDKLKLSRQKVGLIYPIGWLASFISTPRSQRSIVKKNRESYVLINF